MFDALLATLGTLGALASLAAGLRATAAAAPDQNAPRDQDVAPRAAHQPRKRLRGRARASRLQCASSTGKGLRSSR